MLCHEGWITKCFVIVSMMYSALFRAWVGSLTLSLLFWSHTNFNHISDEIISSTFMVRKEPACDSVDQCFLPLFFCVFFFLFKKMVNYTGFIITKSLVSIVDFKIYKIYLKKLPKYFQKKKILNILHISMKLIRVCVIGIDMYVSSFFLFFSDWFDVWLCSANFPTGEKTTNKKNTSSVEMLFFMFALYLQYMSQGHHCSPLLFAKNADYLQMVNRLCTY